MEQRQAGKGEVPRTKTLEIVGGIGPESTATVRREEILRVTRKKILLANVEVRRQQLESFGRAPTLLSTVLRQFPKKKAWLYKPSADRWSIHEIILHLADSEVSVYVRSRHFVAKLESSVLKFDPARWAGWLSYSHQSSHDALEIIRCLRKATYQLLVLLPESVWEDSVEHPEDGRLSLARWIEIQERHIPHHIDQMKQNYDSWLKYRRDRLLVKKDGSRVKARPSRGGRAAASNQE